MESARTAFRAEAVDFLAKPIDQRKLMGAISEAFVRQTAAEDAESRHAGFDRLLATRTPREKEVMHLVIAGHHNREIADELGISMRTVEVHRSRIFDKMKVRSAVELSQILNLLGNAPES